VLVVALVAAGNPVQSLAGAAAVLTGLLVWPRLRANASDSGNQRLSEDPVR
jgi:hypothetical protein